MMKFERSDLTALRYYISAISGVVLVVLPPFNSLLFEVFFKVAGIIALINAGHVLTRWYDKKKGVELQEK